MPVLCTENVRGAGSSFTRYQLCEYLNSAVTTSMNIQSALCEDTVTHSELQTTRAQWVCLDAENSAIVAVVKRLGLIWR